MLAVDITLEARRNVQRRKDAAGRGQRLTFQAIPTKQTTYRPPRVAPAVAAPGAQVAVTTVLRARRSPTRTVG